MYHASFYHVSLHPSRRTAKSMNPYPGTTLHIVCSHLRWQACSYRTVFHCCGLHARSLEPSGADTIRCFLVCMRAFADHWAHGRLASLGDMDLPSTWEEIRQAPFQGAQSRGCVWLFHVACVVPRFPTRLTSPPPDLPHNKDSTFVGGFREKLALANQPSAPELGVGVHRRLDMTHSSSSAFAQPPLQPFE